MNALAKSVARLSETRLLLFTAYILFTSIWKHISAGATAQELLRGFKATPDPKVSSFQPLLNDSTGNFSLAFLRVNKSQLALAVLHLPSSESLWLANLTKLASWSDTTQLFFNGSLVISDPLSNVFWSTRTDGDLVALLNSSNLQIQKLDEHPSVIWQSFEFPTDTLVETQNLTANMSLISSNGLYSMRLGYNFWGLYADFGSNSDQIYCKHTAMEAKAEVVEGQGPIYAEVNTDGYLGMYQNGSKPVGMYQNGSKPERPVSQKFLKNQKDEEIREGEFVRDEGDSGLLVYSLLGDFEFLRSGERREHDLCFSF